MEIRQGWEANLTFLNAGRSSVNVSNVMSLDSDVFDDRRRMRYEMNRILVVDDDLDLCELLSKYLTGEGLDVDLANDGNVGVERALSGEYALVVLDVMLPGLNGFEALSRIRSKSNLPVLMLTARGDDVDRIVGLELGADDYLPKPFNPRELIARIRAILRRTKLEPDTDHSSKSAESITVGDIELDNGTRTVIRGGEQLALTSVE